MNKRVIMKNETILFIKIKSIELINFRKIEQKNNSKSKL